MNAQQMKISDILGNFLRKVETKSEEEDKKETEKKLNKQRRPSYIETPQFNHFVDKLSTEYESVKKSNKNSDQQSLDVMKRLKIRTNFLKRVKL